MKSKKSVPTSIGFEYANNAKLFCDRLCLYLYIGIQKVGPTIEFTPPNFMRMCAPDYRSLHLLCLTKWINHSESIRLKIKQTIKYYQLDL